MELFIKHVRVYINTGATDTIEIETILPSTMPPWNVDNPTFTTAAKAGYGVEYALENFKCSVEVVDEKTHERRLEPYKQATRNNI